MKDACILTSDIGTSSVKTALFDLDGKTLATASQAYTTRHERPGWSDQSAADWWQGYQKSVRSIVAQQPDRSRQIAVIGVSGQMLGCLPVDSEGEPLYPSPIHADLRAAAEADQIADLIGREHIYRLTGNILDARSSLAKLLWFKNQQPDIYREAYRFLQAKDFVVSKLTGQLDSTDYSDAVHAQWLDLERRCYLTDVLQTLGLAARRLPAVHKGSAPVGRLAATSANLLGLTAGIPVVAGAGDGACAAVGAGAGRPGDVHACRGTTAWICGIRKKPVFDPGQRLFNLISSDGDAYGVFGTTQNAGHAVRWAMRLFTDADETTFDRLAGQVPPGSEGLVFLPYLDGERTPVFDADARGIFFGVGSRHDARHFRRSVLEGVALAFASIVAIFREADPVSRIRLIGGGARSELWRGMIASACQVDLECMATPSDEATALGMALTAGCGVGLNNDLGNAQQIVKSKSIEQPDKGLVAVYSRIYPLYAKLYEANKALFTAL